MTGERGFSLVEVMVALAIFSVAGVGLTRVATQNTRTALAVEERALAAVVADNHLAERLIRRENTSIGERTETLSLAGREFMMRESVLETGTAGLVEVRVFVRQLNTAGVPAGSAVERRAFRRKAT